MDDDSSAPKNRAGKGSPARVRRPPLETSDARRRRLKDRKPSHVTSIRHWSTPEYTRIAIGLEKDVKFEAQRIENPERIFFDLLDTNLTSSLLGKTFDVDEALLKKIRVAQFQPGKSRIVLEVADGSDYSTSMLTDPPRLIIDIHRRKDIHSKDIRSKNSGQEGGRETPLKESAAADETVKASTAAPRPQCLRLGKPRHRPRNPATSRCQSLPAMAPGKP